MSTFVRMCFHLALDNILVTKVKAVEVLDNSANPDATLLAPIILQVLGDLPLIQVSLEDTSWFISSRARIYNIDLYERFRKFRMVRIGGTTWYLIIGTLTHEQIMARGQVVQVADLRF